MRGFLAVDRAARPLTRPVTSGLVTLTGRGVLAREEVAARVRRRPDGPGTAWPPAERSPAERFDSLAGWPYETRYVAVQPGGYRMAYVDEGPRDGQVVWLQHGNPAWGYYFRAAIDPLVAAGFRVVVPDLVGFGRSDKPTRRSVHTYANHEAWLLGFLEALDLRGINAHLHDWGGLLGLRLVAFHPERFARVLAANTSLPIGEGGDVPALFRLWQLSAQVLPSFGAVIAQEAARPLPPEVVAAYDAPFPRHGSGLAPRQLPLRVPLRENDDGAARNRATLRALGGFDKPFLTAFSYPDEITKGADTMLQAGVAGAHGRPHRTFPGTKHYIMEDAPDELTQLMIEFFSGALD